MKNSIFILTILMSLLIHQQKSFSQATIANNNNGALDFLGGNVLSGKAVDIGQMNALGIDFYTNGLAYPFAPLTKRINIFDAPLNQNVPNPFAEQTTISYFLTDEIKKAQIFFYDNRGTILKIVDIPERGAGQLNVFAADLSSGAYIYSLVADGNLIETKKMVKQ